MVAISQELVPFINDLITHTNVKGLGLSPQDVCRNTFTLSLIHLTCVKICQHSHTDGICWVSWSEVL